MTVTTSIVTEGLEVRAEVRISAPARRVFEHLTDPEKLVRWMGTEAELVPVPGGVYRCVVTPTHKARGEFVEVVPYSRVVYTWGWEDGDPPPGSTQVEITLQEEGSETILRMVHRQSTPEIAQAHGEGWEHYLPRLAAVAGGHDPGPDPWIGG